MAVYERPVRQLMREMVEVIGLKPGKELSRGEVISWFEKNYPNVKRGTITAHLTRMSVNMKGRHSHKLKSDGSDDLFYQIDSRRFRLYEPARDSSQVSADSVQSVTSEDDNDDEVGVVESSEFAYEHDLRDYLAKNLGLVEPGLTLYCEDGLSGIEFPVGGRYIDILAVDSEGGLVVLELKVSKGYDRVIGQLLRYIGWIEQNLAEPKQRVRGMIVAKNITTDLILACSRVTDVKLLEYELSVSIKCVR